MEINKNNYEAYFLDYHEGNLSPQQVADVLLFVQNHPELKEELESFENFSIEDYPAVTFENKADLKKEITEANREEYFIKAVENTLNPAEKKLLDDYIKRHPQVIVDYHLFQKTRLQADAGIVFENKDSLKKALTPSFAPLDKLSVAEGSEALIAYVEGVLPEKEKAALDKKIAGNVLMQKELAMYQQTKLKADATIVFENKDDLKRKERRVIPLYYYMAAAAAIVLLFGLFFIFNSNKGEEFAKNNFPKNTIQVPVNVAPQLADKAITYETKNANVPKAVASSLVKQSKRKQSNTANIDVASKNDSEKQNKEQFPVTNINEVPIEKEQPIAENNSLTNSVNGNQEPIAKSQEPASDIGHRTSDPNEYLSLKEIAVKKLKESTLDEKTLEAEKKSGRLKKFSGWDLAKVVAKGINKVTGSDVKVEPKYNDEGEVTAYALGAGSFEIARGR